MEKGRDFGGVHKFSLSPSSNYNLSTFHFSSITGFLFLFLFFVFSIFGFVRTCWVLLLFLLLLLLLLFFSFFFLNFNYNYFFKKTLLDDFLCYFLKCSLSSIHKIFKKYNVLLFVLFKKDMMVNLYKFYFQPNQKIFHPSTFPPSQSNTNEEN